MRLAKQHSDRELIQIEEKKRRQAQMDEEAARRLQQLEIGEYKKSKGVNGAGPKEKVLINIHKQLMLS